MKRTSRVFLAAALAACNSGTEPTTLVQTCTVTLGGAASGSASCLVVVVYLGLQNRSFATLAVPSPPAPFNGINGLIDLAAGDVVTGSFTQSTTIDSQIFATVGSGLSWFESKGKPVPDQGTVTLVLSSTGAAAPSGADKAYPLVAGTLDATLPPGSGGASGTVTLHAEFHTP